MTRVLEEIKARHGNVVTTELNPGEGAFYGPKFEYVLRDAIGRDWQCGTTQVDFNLPERFGAFYIAPNSEKTTPVMVHRAICGSMERFIGILLENYAGPPAAVARAACRSSSARSRRRATNTRWRSSRAPASAACASKRTCATRRSATRCASIRWPKSPCCSRSARKRPPSARVSIRRLGSNAQLSMSDRGGAGGIRGGGDAAGSRAGLGAKP